MKVLLVIGRRTGATLVKGMLGIRAALEAGKANHFDLLALIPTTTIEWPQGVLTQIGPFHTAFELPADSAPHVDDDFIKAAFAQSGAEVLLAPHELLRQSWIAQQGIKTISVEEVNEHSIQIQLINGEKFLAKIDSLFIEEAQRDFVKRFEEIFASQASSPTPTYLKQRLVVLTAREDPIEKDNIQKKLEHYAPGFDVEWALLPQHTTASRINAESLVLLADADNAVIAQYAALGEKVFNVDCIRNASDALEWARLTQFLSNEKADVIQSKQRFCDVIAKLRALRLTKSYVFATGPSLEHAHKRSWDDGYRIVCNTIVRDPSLWAQLKPHFMTAGDAVAHFGHTQHARTFREDLKQRLRETATYFVYPEIFHAICAREFKEFSDRLIPVPEGMIKKVNIDLCNSFAFPPFQNVLGTMLLPIASTLARHVLLWGFDGPTPSQRVAWKNSSRHAYPELIDEMTKAHPCYFERVGHNDNPGKYFKVAFGEELDKLLQVAEQQGWRYEFLHPSWTPTLQKRYVFRVPPSIGGVSRKPYSTTLATGRLRIGFLEREFEEAVAGAVVKLGRGEKAGAIALLRAHIASKPDNVDALVTLGRLYFDQEQYNEALQCFRDALRVDGNDIDAWIGITLIARVTGNLPLEQSAIKMLELLSVNLGSLPLPSQKSA